MVSRVPGFSVISHTHPVPDFGPVVQLRPATEFGGVAIDGEIPNSGIRQAATGSGITKGKIVGAGAVIGLARTKMEGDSITLAIDGAAAIDLGGHHDSRILRRRCSVRTLSPWCSEHWAPHIEFRARERNLELKCSSRDKHHAVGQESCGMGVARGVEAAGV